MGQPHVQDHGLHVFHHDLTHYDITIRMLTLWNYGCNASIIELTTHCSMKVLLIDATYDQPAICDMLFHWIVRIWTI